MKKIISPILLLVLVLAAPGIVCGCAPVDPLEDAPWLDQVYVHGEHALLYLDAGSIAYPQEWLDCFALKSVLTDEDSSNELPIVCGKTVNQGLALWQLAPGNYNFWLEDQLLYADDFSPLEGYTLLRDGIRKHWLFSADPQSKILTLLIEDVSQLPDGYCDIFIDVGHGGEDTGARTYRYIEADENLKAAKYMAEQLEAKGFVVRLSRYDEALPGGEAAEDNPYLAGARVDSIYQSHASYLLSNHLNGSNSQESGFQLYTSVHTDNAWADFIAQEFAEMGWHANDENYGLIENGMYKRWARDNYHSDRDYYFILRETGGYALAPYRYLVHNDETADMLRRGPEGILLEYLFLDNNADMAYWQDQYPALVDAVLDGSYQYWQSGE